MKSKRGRVILFTLFIGTGLSFFLKKKLFIIAKYANEKNAKLVIFNFTAGAIVLSLVVYVLLVLFGGRIHWIVNAGLIYFLIVWFYYVWFCWLLDDERILKSKKLLWSVVVGSITLIFDACFIVYFFPMVINSLYTYSN